MRWSCICCNNANSDLLAGPASIALGSSFLPFIIVHRSQWGSCNSNNALVRRFEPVEFSSGIWRHIQNNPRQVTNICLVALRVQSPTWSISLTHLCTRFCNFVYCEYPERKTVITARHRHPFMITWGRRTVWVYWRSHYLRKAVRLIFRLIYNSSVSPKRSSLLSFFFFLLKSPTRKATSRLC